MFPHNTEGTNLSAEVPPFVPRKDWLNEQQGRPSSTPLPRYITTCYPFVQEQQDGRGVLVPSHLQSMPANPGVRWPGQPLFPPPFGPPAVPAAHAIPHSIVGFGDAPGNIADSVQTSAVYGSSIQPPLPSGYMSKSRQSSQQHNRKSGEKYGSKKISKRNVGTQKEANMHGSDSKCDSPTMVDNCQQTDFPSDIACKSLTDKPSPLKRTSRNRRQRRSIAADGNHESSSGQDDADVDSDSGYYSPKRRIGHKRNGGTSTSGYMGREQQGNAALQPVVLIPPPVNPSTSVIYPTYVSTSPQLHSNVLTSHVTPPPPHSTLNQLPITSRPPPGFPIPPCIAKPSTQLQLPNGYIWNGSHYLHPNYVSQPPTSAHSYSSYQNPGSNQQWQTSPKHEMASNRMNKSSGSPKGQKSDYNSKKQDAVRSHNSRGRNKQYHDQRNAIYSQIQQPIQPPSAVEHPLFLEDVQEFPGLGGMPYVQAQNQASKLSYRQALAQKPGERTQTNQVQVHQPQPSSSARTAKNQEVSEKAQKSKKRWKKAERASKAADEEYAEITKEHENIKKALRKTATAKNRSKTPMLDLGEVVSKLETKSSSKQASGKKLIQVGGAVVPMRGITSSSAHKSRLAVTVNPLDVSGPTQKRGKEREVPKVKKPSALKKVILKEREEKKEQRLNQLSTMSDPDHDIPPFPPSMLVAGQGNVSDSNEEELSLEVKFSEFTVDDVPSSVPQIHSRRYREYCCQVLDKKIDETCTIILQKLVQFQDRQYQKDPIKAKMKRRLVMGLREVTKHLKLKKLKCVIISPNLEKIQSKGGLDDALQQILKACEEQNVTYIFALGRKAMGRAVSKLVPVSIVGIFDYSGAEDHYKKLVELVADAQNKYKEMVSIYQQEVVEAHTPTVQPQRKKRFAHMTHSRNASAASCISFASFISEPISEMNEGSNWRVMMDAGEESNLSPPPEGDGSLCEEESNSLPEDSPAKNLLSEKFNRKDSGSTFVESKTSLHRAGSVIKEENETSSHGKESNSDLSDKKDTLNKSQKTLEQSFSTSSTAVPQQLTNPTSSHTPEDDPAMLIKTLEDTSSSSIQDRVSMWLVDTQCSVPDKDDEDSTPIHLSQEEENVQDLLRGDSSSGDTSSDK